MTEARGGAVFQGVGVDHGPQQAQRRDGGAEVGGASGGSARGCRCRGSSDRPRKCPPPPEVPPPEVPPAPGRREVVEVGGLLGDVAGGVVGVAGGAVLIGVAGLGAAVDVVLDDGGDPAQGRRGRSGVTVPALSITSRCRPAAS